MFSGGKISAAQVRAERAQVKAAYESLVAASTTNNTLEIRRLEFALYKEMDQFVSASLGYKYTNPSDDLKATILDSNNFSSAVAASERAKRVIGNLAAKSMGARAEQAWQVAARVYDKIKAIKAANSIEEVVKAAVCDSATDTVCQESAAKLDRVFAEVEKDHAGTRDRVLDHFKTSYSEGRVPDWNTVTSLVGSDATKSLMDADVKVGDKESVPLKEGEAAFKKLVIGSAIAGGTAKDSRGLKVSDVARFRLQFGLGGGGIINKLVTGGTAPEGSDDEMGADGNSGASESSGMFDLAIMARFEIGEEDSIAKFVAGLGVGLKVYFIDNYSELNIKVADNAVAVTLPIHIGLKLHMANHVFGAALLFVMQYEYVGDVNINQSGLHVGGDLNVLRVGGRAEFDFLDEHAFLFLEVAYNALQERFKFGGVESPETVFPLSVTGGAGARW